MKGASSLKHLDLEGDGRMEKNTNNNNNTRTHARTNVRKHKKTTKNWGTTRYLPQTTKT
jgi:hypothetical protein